MLGVGEAHMCTQTRKTTLESFAHSACSVHPGATAAEVVSRQVGMTVHLSLI